MARDFDLTSERWLSLIFEGKNQEYGAYEIRNDSSNRHLKALIIVTIVSLSAVFLPKLIQSVIPKDSKITIQEEVTMVDVSTEVPEENQIKELENVPPPPLLKETIQFTPPVIARDDEVVDDRMVNQEDLTKTDAQISVITVEGGSKDGVDAADLIDHKVVVQEEKPEIFNHVEVMPSFPGGEKEMLRWLSENIKYPTVAQEQGIQGRVILRFVVKPNGEVGNVEVQRSLDPSLDKEAVRVVQKMPKWIPGKQNGNAVHVYYTLPVLFKLQN